MTAAPDAVPARRGRPGYDVARLLAVAVEVFNERGYDGTSMEDLSRRLGIAKSAIYHHVSGKEELLRLALDRALDGLFAVADEARALLAPAIERLERLVRGSVEVLQAELPYVTLLLRVRGNTDVERAALNRRRAFDRVVADLVKQAERDGDIRPDVDPAVTARLLFGMVNSLFAVIIPSISTPLLILLFRQASRSFPYEIIEAARMDGLKELGIFARIYVPTMKSTFAAAAVITFMASWNNFLWPRVILLDNAVQTMPMLIANLTAGYVTDYGVLMLAVLLTSLPTIIIFLILQRAFAQGITGAIK